MKKPFLRFASEKERAYIVTHNPANTRKITMPEHLIRSFFTAKEFCDTHFDSKRKAHLPALKGKDFKNVLQYIKLLSPKQE